MLELQALGAQLVELSGPVLAGMQMPDELRAAVLEAKRITAHEGRRRQMQYIGRLMRDIDPAPLRSQLDALTGHSSVEIARHKRLEALREKLLADDGALTDFVALHARADLQELRTLIRNARKEAALPAEQRHGRAWRELFQYLKPALVPVDG